MVCSTLLADVGTPLIWLGQFQLLGGNLLIAALEAWLIRRFFHVDGTKRRVFWIMAAANYFSMLIGVILLEWLGQFILTVLAGDQALYILSTVIVLLFAASYVLTLILEWPFCYRALGERPNRFRDSLKADLAAQTASYLILLPLVLLASGFSLVISGHPDRALVSRAPDIATIYYLSPDRQSLWKVRLNGTGREKVKDLKSSGGQSRPYSLYLSRPAGRLSWDLWSEGSNQRRMVLANVPDEGAVAWRVRRNQDGGQGGAPEGRSSAATLGTEDGNAWNVRTGGFLPGTSLVATKRDPEQEVILGLETPFVMWQSRCLSLLPGELVVYQLGSNIVLLDLPSRRIGVITTGHSPVVVVDGSAVPRPTSRPATSQIAVN